MAQAKNVAQGAYVTVIDSRETTKPKLRVAAYARVSSDSEDQINSYIAQVDYYTRYISQHEDWELADIYADEGLSGMEVKHREEFNRMIADCRKGEIDRLLVKSVSRFARNQEDYIYFMRELMGIGVTICFEKENIDTGKMTSEQIADIYGAFAQMETTGHSQNMRVSYRMKMEKGDFVPAKAPYGYNLNDRRLSVIPKEADVVRHIFCEYLNGRGKLDIAKELNRNGVPRRQPEAKWSAATIDYILTNVTYTGDQLWHKTFMTDVLPYEVFSAISEKAPDCRRNALKRFLELNTDFEIFRKLPLEASSWGGCGSLIPYMQQRIDYLFSILPLLSGIAFLKHKQKVLDDIEVWRCQIKNEEIEELLTSLG